MISINYALFGLFARLSSVSALMFSVVPDATAQGMYLAEPERGQTDDIPYQRYFTRDALGRRITFYVTKSTESAPHVPLVVSILGSGSDSNVACRVAAMNAFVTHVASLAGGGPTRAEPSVRFAPITGGWIFSHWL